ncbi:MAG: class I SAM-dependent methyltransferase [Ignavibacteriaceae bacterium]
MNNFIKNYFPLEDLNEDAKQYLRVHTHRYQFLLNVVQDIRVKLPEANLRILDVGPSIFTKILEKSFPADTIISLGLEHEKSRGGHLPAQTQLEKDRFFFFNLNDSQFPEKWVNIPHCDIIILAEVLEHLYTAPTLVLGFLQTCLKPGGSLVIQTPNAAALKNRILMLFGKNPFQMIRENSDNPGHFREYTLKELISISEKSGFTVDSFKYKNYFGAANIVEKIYTAFTNLLPGAFKSGITIVLKKK